MKKLLVVAVALASVNAFATRARVNALANSPHLIDTQTVYSNPADMFYVGGDYVTAESGTGAATGRNGQNNAEGMVVRSWGDAKAGLSLGHMSGLATTLRSTAGLAAAFPSSTGAAGPLLQQNPIELSYGMKAGDLAWAGTLVYSKSESKLTLGEKEDTMGLRGGFRMGAMDGKLAIGLANNYSNETDGKFTGTMGVQAGFGYWLDTTYLSANATSAGFKVETKAGTEVVKYTSLTYGVSATNSVKKDGSEFFYGAGLQNTEVKVTQGAAPATSDVVTTIFSLPVTLGVEVDANSWMTFRGSVTQAVPLLNTNKKTTTPAGGASTTNNEDAPITNNTAFAAGVGLKFNKLTVDGTIVTGTSQVYDSTKLLSQVAMTYMF